jgi:hypothetical protein
MLEIQIQVASVRHTASPQIDLRESQEDGIVDN